MPRQKRKLDHLKYALDIPDETTPTGFSDIFLVHRSAPELNLSDVDSGCSFLGKKLKAPLMINAITGGHPETAWINKELSQAAGKAGIGMAVGSQRAALDDPSVAETFCVAREANPDGLLLANLSAGCTPDEARAAVDMIAADGIQLYLNAPQELFMTEGEPRFKGVLDNIKAVAAGVSVPVVVKEVGFGLSRETVALLYQAGIRHVDVGGRGGTDFIAIELARSGKCRPELKGWGIPTAISLLEGLSLDLGIDFVASGGLRSSLDLAKALVAGAGLTAMSRPFLEALLRGSPRALAEVIEDTVRGLGLIMMLTGSENLAGMRKKPLIISGFTAEWLTRRGIDVNLYARR